MSPSCIRVQISPLLSHEVGPLSGVGNLLCILENWSYSGARTLCNLCNVVLKYYIDHHGKKLRITVDLFVYVILSVNK